MKRKIISFGLLSPSVWSGQALTHPTDVRIYTKLKQIGFRETPWQYVYDGQLAGLVIPIGNGINEIHIRFYKDRFFAELEVGRALISHFFSPQYDARNIILFMTKTHLSAEEMAHLKKMLNGEKTDDENALNVWIEDTQLDPYASIIHQASKNGLWLKSCFAGLGWKSIALYIFPLTSLILMMPSFEVLGGILGSLSALTGLLLPSVGKP